MNKVITDISDLLSALDLPLYSHKQHLLLQDRFPLKVPESFISMIQKGDPNDPLLRQILPDPIEMEQQIGFSKDPVGDATSSVQPGLLQKYYGRALLYVTNECLIHCRFCFRQHFKKKQAIEKETIKNALNYLSNNTSISEIILSGGDPLTLQDNMLTWIIEKIDRIPQIKRIRIHTRIPVFNPDRLTSTLLKLFESVRCKVILVLHINHPNEVSTQLQNSIHSIQSSSIQLLSQSVLLKGVNDSLEVLAELFEKLVHLSIHPYYLHLLDKVEGTAHFQVSEKKGAMLMHELRKKLPGYAIPAFVKEVPGFTYKIPISSPGNSDD